MPYHGTFTRTFQGSISTLNPIDGLCHGHPLWENPSLGSHRPIPERTCRQDFCSTGFGDLHIIINSSFFSIKKVQSQIHSMTSRRSKECHTMSLTNCDPLHGSSSSLYILFLAILYFKFKLNLGNYDNDLSEVKVY